MPEEQVIKLVNATSLDAGLTSIADAIREKGGTSADLTFPAGFVSAVEAIPTGGGGAVLVASGTFVGASEVGRQTISVGTKMPVTDFYVQIKAQDNSVFNRASYRIVAMTAIYTSEFGYFSYANTGDAVYTSTFKIYDKNGDSETLKNAGLIQKDGIMYSNGNVTEYNFNTFTINRTAETFRIYFGHSNGQYGLPSDVTYEYKIIYFGDDAANEIYEIE
jgi:hypothetical protein